MRTEKRGDTLVVDEILTLNSESCRLFKEMVHGALLPEHKVVEVDLSRARTVDSDGIGALISVQKAVCGRGGKVRLIRPAPMIADMFKLLQLDRVFEVVPG
jgi:anti-anti-sigma factor